MRIRTQLVVAFLILSVLPLTAIVLYSYFSSVKAVRVAYEADAKQTTVEMHGRMAEIRDDIHERVQDLGEYALSLKSQQAANDPNIRKVFIEKLGKAAPLVKTFEVVPQPPAAPAQVAAVAPVSPTAETPTTPKTPKTKSWKTTVHGPDHPVGPIVVDVEKILRDTQVAVQNLPPERRDEIMRKVQKDMERIPKNGRIEAPPPPPTPDEKAPAEEEVTDDGTGNEETPVAIEANADDEEPADETAAPPAETRDARSVDRDAQKRAAREQRLREAALRRAERERRVAEKQREFQLLVGKEFEVPVVSDGSLVGKVRAEISGEEVLHRVLDASKADEGEVAFAVDREGKIYTSNPGDQLKLAGLPLVQLARGSGDTGEKVLDKWVVATNRDSESGLTYGIARPIRRPLERVRETAAQNFAYGLGLIAIALFGIVPIANHITRDVQAISAGAERIAQGDLTTRVPVRSSNEFGHLADSFNRMARDLSEHQMRLFEEERRRREQEISQRLLEAEYQRKSLELEEARSFQLSLLPKTIPTHPRLSIDVFMRTAAEVGGDYYDFLLDGDDVLTAVVGDATGHGARAATMVTVIKSLFAAYTSDLAPARFLDHANETVKRMQLGRMAMGLTLARFADGVLTVSAAGMPPLLVRRASGEVEEIPLAGTPLGTLTHSYNEASIAVGAGDVLLIMSDGFPELVNAAGEPFGYERVCCALQEAGGAPSEVIRSLVAAADEWSEGEPQHDDITFVVVRVS